MRTAELGGRIESLLSDASASEDWAKPHEREKLVFRVRASSKKSKKRKFKEQTVYVEPKTVK